MVAERFRFILHIVLVDRLTRAVVLTREFDEAAPVVRANPATAVAAANRVVAKVLRDVAMACAGKIAPAD
jgi:ribonuclease HII